MLSGKPSPELPTDQECEHCGRFFGLDGIESHEESCRLRESESVVYVDGEYRSSKCEDCGIWATLEGTEHRPDCKANTDSPDCLGSAHSILVPFDLPEVKPSNI